MPKQMLDESAQRNQTTVSRRDAVVPSGLQMIEKSQYSVGLNIVQAETRDRSSGAISQEAEEQPERVSVHPPSVRARSPDALEIILEIGLHECEQSVVRASHRCTKRRRKRRDARSSKAGVA